MISDASGRLFDRFEGDAEAAAKFDEAENSGLFTDLFVSRRGFLMNDFRACHKAVNMPQQRIFSHCYVYYRDRP